MAHTFFRKIRKAPKHALTIDNQLKFYIIIGNKK